MLSYLKKFNEMCDAIPHDLIAYVARIAVGTTFLRSGLLKIEGWNNGNTLALFTDEYRLPLLPPDAAAYLATSAELILPILLFAGFLTRYAALGLLMMTIVIEVFVYPNAFDTHGLWAVALIFLMRHGPGAISIDRFLGSGSEFGRATSV
jgi:putative oxidoreductase